MSAAREGCPIGAFFLPREIEWLSPVRVDLFLKRDGPMLLFLSMMPQFLRFFSPHLDLEWLEEPSPDERTNGASVIPQRSPRNVPLYAICALELFNHVIVNAEYRICANENCRRTFVHQQGRSEKGQQRSRGVKFCTAACARATAQRDYRRRRRSKSTD
jgi:hypothetical protein